MKFIDISGFGHSGKTAVTDYLKQYPCVFGFPNHVEFELFRVSGGLIDLYFSLFESWNLIRSTVRINEFNALVHRIGRVQRASDPMSYFMASAHGYNQYFNDKFIDISEAFIDKLIAGRQNTFWPYENLRVNPLRLFLNKFKSKYFNTLLTSEIYFSNRNDFLDFTKEYMQQLFQEAVQSQHSHVLLNNGFDPFNPIPCLNMIGDGYAITVDRDPRDIYASQIDAQDIFIPDFEKTKGTEEIKRAMTGFDNIDLFIFRFKTLKQNVVQCNDSRVIKLRYEDFIMQHDEQVASLKSILNLPEEPQLNGKGFNVQNSMKNIGIWKKYQHLEEIKKIEKELGEYCYSS